jgi:2-methylaconitate cis-trans-isomerase PrpF
MAEQRLGTKRNAFGTGQYQEFLQSRQRGGMMEIQEMIRCTLMRGGTSKGVFFLKNDLPKDKVLRDKVIRRVFGAPDPREIDGLGGADNLTSKLAIIGPPTRGDCDVDYLFGQVSLVEPMIDYRSNCGNISSAVGPFAIDEGLVDPVEPVTKVRIHQVNTGKVIIAEVPVRGNKAEIEGDHAIAGCPGTGAKIILDWADSAGSITGKLLPTGNVTDILHVQGEGDMEVSLVDAAIPTVFIRAGTLGLKGSETPQEIDADGELLEKIEKIRSYSAEKMQLCDNWRDATKKVPYSPFFAICAPPLTYKNWTTGEEVHEDSVDLVVRLLFMQKMHKTYPVTGTVCTVAASMIPGTIANELARPGIVERAELRIGHPAGVITAEGKVEIGEKGYALRRATVDRTARCLMKGYAFVPKGTLSPV